MHPPYFFRRRRVSRFLSLSFVVNFLFYSYPVCNKDIKKIPKYRISVYIWWCQFLFIRFIAALYHLEYGLVTRKMAWMTIWKILILKAHGALIRNYAVVIFSLFTWNHVAWRNKERQAIECAKLEKAKSGQHLFYHLSTVSSLYYLHV